MDLKIHKSWKGLWQKVLGKNFSVYDHTNVEKLSTIIKYMLPVHQNGVNWGIRQVKATFSRCHLCIPTCQMVVALKIILGFHYDPKKWTRHLWWMQYNLTQPMVLWHIDCEFLSLWILHFEWGFYKRWCWYVIIF